MHNIVIVFSSQEKLGFFKVGLKSPQQEAFNHYEFSMNFFVDVDGVDLSSDLQG